MKWILFFLVFSCAHKPNYKNVLKNYPVKDVLKTCVKIDLRSHRLAWYFRTNITTHNTDLSKPNFNGRYYLLESPLSRGSNWFVADCKTGNVKGTDFEGDLLFNVSSSVLVKQEASSPEVYHWVNDEMVMIKNPIQAKN